jgi:uncharacterized protein (TIGR02271 family)
MTNTMTANRTVVALFDDFETANRAATKLESAGIPRDQISVVAGNESGRYESYVGGSGEVGKGIAGGAGAGAAIGGGLGLIAGLMALAIPGFGPVIAAGPIAAALTGAGIGAAAGGLIGGLKNAGVSEADAEYYAEGVRRGGVLLTLRTSDAMADNAVEILDSAGAVDVDEKASEWRSSGWSPKHTARTDTKDMKGDRTLDVVQEEIEIGKREVGRRKVRIYSDVTERPVEKQVHLRDETVHVDRRAVDRPATPGDLNAFREGQIELTETHEEPVVEKRARVVEEVRVGKEVKDRTETVRDTVKRKDVRVEEAGGKIDYDNDPGYKFGTTYATDARYRGREWNDVEADIRRDWGTRGQGSWEEFKDRIRHGWDRARDR